MERARDFSDVSASPSRVVESVGTFTERHQFWKEKDEEEIRKRESITSIEDYTQGFDNSAFAGVETIDTRTVEQAVSQDPHRTPSPYEIERSNEAIFLDTDDPNAEEEVKLEDLVQYQVSQNQQHQQHLMQSRAVVESSPERKVLFQGMSSSSERSISVDSEQQLKEQISREIFEAELAEKIESLEPESKSLIQEAYEIRDDSPSDDKSETETTEKLKSSLSTEERLEDVRYVASSLVSEIESTLEKKFEGVEPKPSAPSSVDITDEELMSTGDVSSPEPQRSFRFEGTERHESATDIQTGSSVGGTETGTPDTHAVRSSSSGEFFTAHEDNTIKSSSDEPSRPKSWDSSILGQVSNNFPASHSGGSEYQTALGAAVSSSESYLGSLSSDASASGTLVASQIDLGVELLEDDDDESDHAQIRTHVSIEGTTGEQTGTVTTRSIYCEAGSSQGIPPPGTGLPVTLTSSTSGTTVCTQVETTYESSVKGDPELADDQDGNIMIYESSLRETVEPPQRMVRTHRRSESQSWGDSPLRYGIEERIEEEQLKDIVFPSEEEEIQDLFETSDDIEDPIQRPITPEPQFSPDDQPRRIYYPESSFEQTVEGLADEEVEDKRSGGMQDFTMEYERVIAPQQRLEDIEEETSVKNSPKSVMSLEMSSSLPELEERNGNGNGNGEKSGRPGSRESSSSLREFERLECAVFEEEVVRKDEPALSEIEEGHESQVSEISEATEICGDGEHDSGELEFDDKMKNLSSQQYETAEDASQMTDIQDLALDLDPMMSFFSTTVMEPQTPDTTETSQLDDFQLRSEMVGTTDADSSLEFRAPGKFTSDNTKMTSSGDSLDDQSGSKNLMEVSRDSLDFEQDKREPTDIPEMVGSADSLTGARRATQLPFDELSFETDQLRTRAKEAGMSDSLEMQPGQAFPATMTESADSLNDGRSTSERSAAGAAGGLMMTSSDSLEGQAIDPSASSTTSTGGDAAMWSSIGGGSASTLVSSQEDLTLENQ
ncbi:unnamed protein product [Orchesella dallaii]|uniref:Uncharacterized protein n=1 Tax=Orchesella dallaii TaxID=48710 RepID=A0ABP1QLG7_9HEXA